MRKRPPASPRTGGFTLVEVMVSMTLLSVGSLALASMLVRATRLAGAAAAHSYQTAMVSAEVNRYDATPFALLVVGTTCTSITSPFQGTRPQRRWHRRPACGATRRRADLIQ